MGSRDIAYKGVLLDIEGTTTPIDFVHRTLFDYSRMELESFLARNAGSPEVGRVIAQLNRMLNDDLNSGRFSSDAMSAADQNWRTILTYIRWLIDHDSKAGPLKELQGLIWEEAYKTGKIHGVVYPDVPAAMKKWHDMGKWIAIYSSGSVLSQKLLFCTTEYGDLTVYISGFFDTRVGPKSDPGSYRVIAEEMKTEPPMILFLSDSPQEVNAALMAGLKSLRVERDQTVTGKDPDLVRDFS